jgi:hypothetical protein
MTAQKQKRPVAAASTGRDIAELLQQYGCGPVPLTGNTDALYEWHLVFDIARHTHALIFPSAATSGSGASI